MTTIVIIDDDRALCRSLELHLTMRGHQVSTTGNPEEGLRLISEHPPQLILLDLMLPGRSGIDILQEIVDRQPDCVVVMITGQQEMRPMIEAMRLGAFDYLRKPFELDEIEILIRKVDRLRALMKHEPSAADATPPPGRPEIIGNDPKIIEVIKQIGLLSRSPVTVLIEGESGTGKELVARAVHEASSADRPFVAVNCSAIVETLMESEFFGHEKGAFTGAEKRKIGQMEEVGEGILFLDEVGDLPLTMQSKLLRVLQEKEFLRVGGLQAIAFRARLITATNRRLEDLIEQGLFREDLYYRLAVSRLELPALRARRGDIPRLVHYYLNRIAWELERAVPKVTEAAIQRLRDHDWPGNIRELINVLTRALALSRSPVLETEQIVIGASMATSRADILSPLQPLEAVEQAHIQRALEKLNWNITQTAKTLEISPTTLRKKIKDFDLRRH